MIWLQRPPWLRWLLTVSIAAGALWVEFGAGATVEHPFARIAISVGEAIVDENIEMRPVPAGLIPQVDPGGFASRPFAPGEPLTPSGVSAETPLPRSEEGWWALTVEVPSGADIGDGVQLVLVDTGLVVPGIIDSLGDEDPLSSGAGAVAIPAEFAVEAAQAIVNGRLVVLVESR